MVIDANGLKIIMQSLIFSSPNPIEPHEFYTLAWFQRVSETEGIQPLFALQKINATHIY